jgi:hypothetical protein
MPKNKGEIIKGILTAMSDIHRTIKFVVNFYVGGVTHHKNFRIEAEENFVKTTSVDYICSKRSLLYYSCLPSGFPYLGIKITVLPLPRILKQVITAMEIKRSVTGSQTSSSAKNFLRINTLSQRWLLSISSVVDLI